MAMPEATMATHGFPFDRAMMEVTIRRPPIT